MSEQSTTGALSEIETADHPNPTVTVVIVNWNGVRHLDECLNSLLTQTLRNEMEIVVVDNGSVDGSVQSLQQYGPQVRTILNPTNVGFAAGCNQGIRSSRGEFVALLNNDAVAQPDWLLELVRAAGEAPDIGSCASKVLSYFDRGTIDNAGHVLFPDGLTRGRGRGEQDRGQFERREEVFGPSGAALLLRRAMLDDVGLFDEHFFAYCEDADLAFRARLRGWRCVYVPTAVVFHKFSASSDAFSAFKAFQVERNRLWLAAKDLPWPLLLLSPLFTLLRYWWQGYGALTGRGASGRFARHGSRLALVSILIRAYLHALAGMPRILRQRRAIQLRRRVPIAEVWGWLRRYGIGARQIALLE